MFLGKYSSRLDKKNRLSVPPAFGGELTDGVYVAQGFDRNLQVLTVGAFREIYARIKALNIADPLSRLLLRMLLGMTYESEPDRDGQILIPDGLKDFALLKEDVLLIGQGDYFEIWSPDLWNAQETQLRDAEANTSRFSVLTISTR